MRVALRDGPRVRSVTLIDQAGTLPAALLAPVRASLARPARDEQSWPNGILTLRCQQASNRFDHTWTRPHNQTATA